MESRVEQAAERKMCGYNCAQAVACTYCDLAGIDEETVRNLTQGFAAGIGGSMEATCGAVIGAVNILGLINKNPQRTMQGSRKIINRFNRKKADEAEPEPEAPAEPTTEELLAEILAELKLRNSRSAAAQTLDDAEKEESSSSER